MNDLLLNHYIALLRDPQGSKQTFDTLQKSRLTRFAKSKAVKPYWLPVTVALDGIAGKIKTSYTEAVDYPLLILGAITNVPESRIRLSAVGEQKPWSTEPVDALATAGADPSSVGMNSPLFFPAPFVLAARNKLAVDFQNVTGVTTIGYYNFIALRVLAQSERDARIDSENDRDALAEINGNRNPRTVFLKMTVPFGTEPGKNVDGASIENRTTQEQDVPLLVLGATTPLENCLMSLTDSSGNIWSPSKVPVWAIASRSNTRKQPFSFFPKPFYLPTNSVLRGNFTNGINGNVEAADKDITFICQTP
jgi:hypothetical protein